MTHSTEFIILASTKTGENSLVLHTLSRAWGRRSFICSVSKNTSMALFMPLNILEAEVVENPKSELWRVRNISAGAALNGIRGNMYKNTMTLFMSEVLYRTIKDGANEDNLFDWCKKSILTLDAIQEDFSNYHLRFLLEFAQVLGFSPSEGGIEAFAGDHLKNLQQMMSLSFAESMMLPLNGEARNAMADALLKYIGHHTESTINVRSLKVLRELFA